MNQEELQTIKEGTILHDSWGYDMTINEYCIVLSSTGKTFLCQMVGRKVTNDDGRGGGKAIPNPEYREGKPFRVKIRRYKDGYISLPGSYPVHVNKDGSEDKRKGYWSIWKGTPNYHNTWD